MENTELDTVPRNEKKARKAFVKVPGLTEASGFTKIEIRRHKQMPVVINKPLVYEVAGKNPSYLIFGQLRIDDLRDTLAKHARMYQEQQQAAMAAQAKQNTETDAAAPAAQQEEEEVDMTGVDESDVKLAMEQTGKKKSEVVAQLRKCNNDVIEAIMQLTS